MCRPPTRPHKRERAPLAGRPKIAKKEDQQLRPYSIDEATQAVFFVAFVIFALVVIFYAAVRL
jgi:hypothetical protein